MNQSLITAVAEAIAPNHQDAPVYKREAEKGINALMIWLMEQGHVPLYDRLYAVLQEPE